MTTTELINSAQFIIDQEGNRKGVVLEVAVWEEIVAIIEGYLADPDSKQEDELLVKSGVLPQLIEQALQEPPAADWEQELSEL
jgi:hypothetical protein